ncbi:MAG: pyridoxal phosphate-dependent aminotransferase [Bryobacterales bacterium]|nr:pyridoxal phosphate-dependent aminotransferase [Bryobacterales bacterium]
MFSGRIPWELAPNEYSQLLERKRQSGARLLDLTESNPTRAGLAYPEAIAAALADARSLVYEPSPLGAVAAREAVAREMDAPVDRILLTASTSESYSYLFKLLCDPGDAVLTPQPSYPLFEFLATLESVALIPYRLRYEANWEIDFDWLEHAVTERTRALLLVNPNNPTGSFVRREEVSRLAAVCRKHGLALISDEVFACYPMDKPRPIDWSEVEADSLVFRLDGLSKRAGLPQMKAGWMVVGGPAVARSKAMERLELIADTYLSVSTPVQNALPRLLELGAEVRRKIQERTQRNLRVLKEKAKPLPIEGGWSAILPLGAGTDELGFVLSLLERDNVQVQPGFFYDFEEEGYAVVSLLPPEDVFAEGVDLAIGAYSR